MIVHIEMGPGFLATCGELSSMGRQVALACNEGLKEGGKLAAGRVVSDYLSGQALKTRTGALRRAVDTWSVGFLEVAVGVRPRSAVDKYAWLLSDEEKTIVPKKSKFLAIPIGEGLTASGVARYSSPREVKDGFFVSTKGRLLFGIRRGKKGKFRPLFTLVKSVFVQGSGALYDGVEDSLDDITALIERQIEKVTG